ncbi:MAG: GIY-YIG nuclease family protein [Vicinamibacterales bacterium]
MAGKSIRIFLVDGVPQGMRSAEVGNWTGIALVSPRTELSRLSQRKEVRRTGVYILLGPSDVSTSGLAVYVGEGDDVWARLRSHDDSKDFWTWVVIFVSKDDNLTKAHVRWLEAALVRDVSAAKRVEIRNGNEPFGGTLPEADVADMEAFLEHVRLLLPTLGADVFMSTAPSRGVGTKSGELMLELRWEDCRAECVVRDGSFIVQKGSTARVTEVPSLNDAGRRTRQALRDNAVLVPVAGNGQLLRFEQDYAFDSPSAAASVVSGTGLNGRVHWKVKGQALTYKAWEEQQLASGAS